MKVTTITTNDEIDRKLDALKLVMNKRSRSAVIRDLVETAYDKKCTSKATALAALKEK